MFLDPEFKRRIARPLFLTVSWALALVVVVAARPVLLPFVLAIVIAYVLTPLVARVERWRVPRAAAILLVYVVVLGTLGGFVRGVAPRMGSEIIAIRREFPTLSAHLRDDVIPRVQGRLRELGLLPPPPPPPEPGEAEPIGHALVARPQPDGTIVVDVGGGAFVRQAKNGWIVEPAPVPKTEPFDPSRLVADAVGKSFAYAQTNALELARIGRDIVAGVARAIFVFAMTLMLGAYLMLTRERVLGFFRSLVRPANRAGFEQLLGRIDRGLAGVVRGQLIICLLNGAFSAVGFALVGLKYWPVLALVATVMSLIPIFGSIASAIPAVAMGLTQSLGTAVFVLIWIIGIHQLEANFLNPKIMGDSAKIHPVLVIFSLLVGEHFFHTIGALLAVPCMSIVQSLFLHFRQIVYRADPDFAGEAIGSLPPPGAGPPDDVAGKRAPG